MIEIVLLILALWLILVAVLPLLGLLGNAFMLLLWKMFGK